MSSRLNPFDALDNVQSSYRSYVETFQNVDDETINAWIENRIETGKVLWKEPFVQLNQRFQYGDALEEFVADDKLHKSILDVFTGADGDPIEPYKHQTESIQSIQAAVDIPYKPEESRKVELSINMFFNMDICGNEVNYTKI